MKPGNLLIQGAKSGGKTRDEDSILRTSGPSVCGFFMSLQIAAKPPCLPQRGPRAMTEEYEKNEKGKTKWKKDYLLLNA